LGTSLPVLKPYYPLRLYLIGMFEKGEHTITRMKQDLADSFIKPTRILGMGCVRAKGACSYGIALRNVKSDSALLLDLANFVWKQRVVATLCNGTEL